MKKYICVLLCTVLLLLSGCAAGEPQSLQTNPQQTEATTTVPSTTAPPEMAYTLTEENGQYLLTFNEGHTLINGCEFIDTPTFSSLEAMKAGIRSGDFTATQLWAINETFPRDESGNVLVCNLEELYEPDVPEGVNLKCVSWYGESYQFEYRDTENDSLIYMCLNYPEQYARDFQEDYSDFLSYETVNLTSQAMEADRNATVYFTESITVKFKEVLYVLQNGDKTLYIREHYRIDNTDSVAPGESSFLASDFSDTVPRWVRFFGIENGVQFHGFIYYPSERPSVEYLLQLGVHPYVETVTE